MRVFEVTLELRQGLNFYGSQQWRIFGQWTICLIQKCLMNDEGISCKVLSNKDDNDNIYRLEVLTNSRASSSGNTGGTSGIRNDWA